MMLFYLNRPLHVCDDVGWITPRSCGLQAFDNRLSLFKLSFANEEPWGFGREGEDDNQRQGQYPLESEWNLVRPLEPMSAEFADTLGENTFEVPSRKA